MFLGLVVIVGSHLALQEQPLVIALAHDREPFHLVHDLIHQIL